MRAPTANATLTLRDLDGALFDFNGTLSDDEEILRDLFIDLASEHFGLTLTALQYQQTLAGRSDREIMADILALAGGGVDSVEIYLPLIDAQYATRIERRELIHPATLDLVKELHGMGLKLGVVTGASRNQVLPALERAGLLGLFGIVVTDEDVIDGKPSPEGFNRAAAALGLKDPSRVAAFEDSLPGLGAVAAAGMIAICIEGTHPRSMLDEYARIVIPRIDLDCLELELGQ